MFMPVCVFSLGSFLEAQAFQFAPAAEGAPPDIPAEPGGRLSLPWAA